MILKVFFISSELEKNIKQVNSTRDKEIEVFKVMLTYICNNIVIICCFFSNRFNHFLFLSHNMKRLVIAKIYDSLMLKPKYIT